MRDCVSQYEQKAEYYTGFITEKIQEIWEPQTETPEKLQSDFVLWLERTGRTSEQEEV
jgi:hypothetical protein